MTSSRKPKSLSKGLLYALNSIKTKLLFSFLFITLVPLIYISYTMLKNSSDQLLGVIVQNSLAHARKASLDLRSLMSSQAESLVRLRVQFEEKSDSISTQSYITEHFPSILEEYDNNNLAIERIMLLSASGEILALSNNRQMKSFSEVEKENILLACRTSNRTEVVKISNSSGRILIGSGISDKDEQKYILAIELNRLQLENKISENVVGRSSIVFVLDDENDVLLTWPETDSFKDYELLFHHIPENEYGVFTAESDALNQPVAAVHLPVIGFGLRILLIQDLDEVYLLVHDFRKNLYWIVLFTVVSAVIIALAISQNIAMPILKLTRGANELASGNLDARISISNTDEVGQLASNFNIMADSLAGKMDELKDAYGELQHRADAIQAANVKLDRKVFEIGTLYKIGQLMSEVGIDLEKLVDIIIVKAMEAAGATRGSLMLINEEGTALTLKRVMVVNPETNEVEVIDDYTHNVLIRPGEGIAGKVFASGQMITINDTENHPDFKQYNSNKGNVKQLCCVPLTVKNTTFGVINIVNRLDGRNFESRDTDLLQTLANQAALALDNTRLFKLAITDGLTGLFMIRHFKIKLNEEIKRCRRYGKIFSIIFFDIDHFKKFNDTYGHQVGDEVLKQTADLFRQSLREDVDLPARYGGEEMIALLPETSAEGAFTVAERLRKSIESCEFEGHDTPLHVTISIGITEYPSHDTEMMELIRKADTALYQCKENGRNQTAIYNDEMGVVSEK